ncbi:hypothetical protein ASPVEDRAFT_84869 [Aspergillus versicolor CBS 583.65]|uniref:Aldehyde dehydrogenase domain-containing protein n=1 Tax=Aspergillus versicolor CBS 583.65 TaxID=1036611 RepID=A0A1L9PPN1_ASPVE|nr:uncharacterized protein ASPVEDRAFT_84869 [Aspergillus versicolor CBS 583.65]OJJ03422.1 hypothetical protein ASPVEDRAFT_84869 [Aspergillus versicolor CBS 583.65]
MSTDTTPAIGFDTFYNVINGKCTTTPATRHGIDPATEEANPEVPLSQTSDVNDAVQAAKSAASSWSGTTYAKRREAILAFAESLAREKDGFAKLLTMEQGKSVGRRFFPRKNSTSHCHHLQLSFAHHEVDGGVHWLRELTSLELGEETVREDEKVGYSHVSRA